QKVLQAGTMRASSSTRLSLRFVPNQISFESPAIRASRGLKRPTDDRFQKYPIACASHSDANSKVELELRYEIEIQGRHDEMLLFLHLGQRLHRAHVAVILDRRRQPFVQPVEQHARRIEL